jgi:hypothetical protein
VIGTIPLGCNIRIGNETLPDTSGRKIKREEDSREKITGEDTME